MTFKAGSHTAVIAPHNFENRYSYDSDNRPIVLDVLANDSDPNGDALTITLITAPDGLNGSATLNSDKTTITYTPQAGFVGTDSFFYVVSDGQGNISNAKVTVDVDLPDLAATAFDVTNDHLLLGQANLTYTISNLRPRAAGAFNVYVIYSDNDVIGDADDVLLDRIPITGLAGNDSITGSIDNLELSLSMLYANAQRETPLEQGNGYESSAVDYIALVVDPHDAVTEFDENNNSGRGKGLDLDDITYFPWDTDGSGRITPTDAIYVINRLGALTGDDKYNLSADFDGSGAITPTDAIASINRLGYHVNNSVIELA